MKIKMDKQGNLCVLSSIPLNGLQLYKEMEISVNLYTVFFFRNTVTSNQISLLPLAGNHRVSLASLFIFH